MKDVAARAGVGLKTVSRVVNGEAGVTPDTERRVQEAIESLGFRRNDSARVLRKGRTASIGLVLEDLADPFYGPLSRAVEEVARAHGALLINGSSAEDPDREQELVLALCARRVDGLIVIPAGHDHRYLEPEIKAGIATVFVDRPAGQIDADVVLSDSFGGARAGVAHLIAHGHRRIGFIGDQPRIHTAVERLRGYRAAMEDAGLEVDDSWVSLGSTAPERVRSALTGMLSGPAPVTALFAGNNRVTVTAVRLLAEHEPQVALVGFDDIELADLLGHHGDSAERGGTGPHGGGTAVPPPRRRGRRARAGRPGDGADPARLGRDPAARGHVVRGVSRPADRAPARRCRRPGCRRR